MLLHYIIHHNKSFFFYSINLLLFLVVSTIIIVLKCIVFDIRLQHSIVIIDVNVLLLKHHIALLTIGLILCSKNE